MKSVSVILLLIFFNGKTFLAPDLASDCRSALSFVKNNSAAIKTSCKFYRNSPAFAVSIVFPEIIRYSLLKDFFETSALETVYVNFGKDYADFSIGRFQMKPSFAEKVEAAIFSIDSLSEKYKILLSYSSKDSAAIRYERIMRLKNLKFQLAYLNCFLDLVEHKFIRNYYSDETVKIKFFATAFNHGFDVSFDEIVRWLNVKSFPYGVSNPEHQYAYSEISSWFYENHKDIFNKNK